VLKADFAKKRQILVETQVGYRTLISGNRNFRNLWFGQIISLLGDWFNLIASASLVAELTQSGLAVGGLFVVRMLAPFMVSPLAGVATDRFNRKNLLLGSDLLRAITVIGFLFVRQPEQVWLLYTLTAVQLGISGVFFPARNAILPDLVPERDLGAANALTSATWSVMLALGAALGGLVSGFWGIYPAFVIDGLTFLLSAVFISWIVYERPEVPEKQASVISGLRDYLEGLRYLSGERDILVIATLKAAIALTVSGAFQVLQVALAEGVYVIGEGGGISLGIMYAVVGVGTGLGPILARYFTGDKDRPMRIAIGIGYAVTVVGLGIIAPLGGFGLVLLGSLLRGIGVGLNWVFSTQLLLQLVPNQVRGRVFSTEFALLTLGNAASAALAGWVLDNTGIGITGLFWGMAAAAAIPGLLWVVWIRPD
jgi:MFS family permease